MVEEHYKQETFNLKLQIRIFLVGILILLFYMNHVSATSFINIYVDESGGALFLGETDDEIQDQLPSSIELKDGEITGFTYSLTSKQGDIWEFSYTLPDSEINLILPKGVIIKELNNGEISIDGESISIYFLNNIKIKYTIVKTQEQPAKSSFNIPLIILLIAILLILIAFFINYSKRERKEKSKKREKKIKKSDKLEIIKQVLSDREKLILEKLEETGKIKSSQLRKLCDIPKASFSRHVQELEKKRIIKRTGEGKNKFVELVGR